MCSEFLLNFREHPKKKGGHRVNTGYHVVLFLCVIAGTVRKQEYSQSVDKRRVGDIRDGLAGDQGDVDVYPGETGGLGGFYPSLKTLLSKRGGAGQKRLGAGGFLSVGVAGGWAFRRCLDVGGGEDSRFRGY